MKKIERSLALWEECGEYVLMSTNYQDILIEQAHGSKFRDVDGNEYIDLCSGQICALVGHNHPVLLQQLIEQMSRVMHTGTHFLSEPVLRASKKLAEIAPRGLKRVMFLSTGAEANEAAFRLAKTYTGKEGIIALTRGYAGLTLATASATNFGKAAHPLVPYSGFVLTPECDRCPVGKTYPGCAALCLDASANLVQGLAERAAAVIVEPIISAGGMIFPPVEYMHKLKTLADEWEALFIVDEAQTGLGRTGKWFGIEHYGITPDILVLSKGAGGGFPCSAVVTTAAIADKIQRKYRNFSSHQSDPAAAAAFLAVVEIIEQHDLITQAAEKGGYFLQRLIELSQKHPLLQRPRGRGLMLGFDIESQQNESKKRLNEGHLLEALALSKGLSVQSLGKGRTFRVLPPLTITQEEIDTAITLLDESLQQIEAGEVNEEICIPQNQFSRRIFEGAPHGQGLIQRAMHKGLNTPPADLIKQLKKESSKLWLKKER